MIEANRLKEIRKDLILLRSPALSRIEMKEILAHWNTLPGSTSFFDAVCDMIEKKEDQRERVPL